MAAPGRLKRLLALLGLLVFAYLGLLPDQPAAARAQILARVAVRLIPRPRATVPGSLGHASAEPRRVTPVASPPRVRFLRPVTPLTTTPRTVQPMRVAARVEPVRRNPFHVLVPEPGPARPP